VVKRWPSERWAAVARGELAAGRRVVVTGSAEERPLAEAVADGAGLPASAVLAGRTDLAGLAAAVAVAGRVACADTGVAHLASAFRVPSVVVFGPFGPDLWGPPPGRPWHRALWSGRPGDPAAESTDPGLLEIEVEAVAAALRTLPAAPATRAAA
jgi:ADP-heptose:LPS heptosyltransferase